MRLTNKVKTMKALQVTKERAVERVIPLSLLGYTKGVGKSKKECGVQYSAEFDSKQKALWRTELFVRYAHRLLECSEQIYADERLFFTPLPLPLSGWIKRGGVYSGKDIHLTLGHIIDWWQNYKCAQVVDEEGKQHYIYGFAFGPIYKFGRPRPADAEPNKVRYIGDDDCGYRIQASLSLYDLGCSLYEVYRRYKHHYYRDHFDLEDAIEYLLGEKVSR